MLFVHQSAFYLHIAVGSCALLLFWVPVFTKKGSLDHKRFGRYFAWAMYIVAMSGFIMASLDLIMPLTAHAPAEALSSEDSQRFVAEVRNLALFLFSLSILVLASTRQGWLSILHRDDRGPLRTPLHTGLLSCLIAVGITLGVYGVYSGSILFMVFGTLQIAIGIGSLWYNYKKALSPKEWWVEHLRGLIGSGIGAYTAFFVFGGQRIIEAIFQETAAGINILLWVAPGVVGSVFITYLSRQYRNKFGLNAA